MGIFLGLPMSLLLATDKFICLATSLLLVQPVNTFPGNNK